MWDGVAYLGHHLVSIVQLVAKEGHCNDRLPMVDGLRGHTSLPAHLYNVCHLGHCSISVLASKTSCDDIAPAALWEFTVTLLM